MKADRSDPIIRTQSFEHPRDIDIGLVANGKNAGQGQGAVAHGEIAGDVAGLGYYCNT